MFIERLRSLFNLASSAELELFKNEQLMRANNPGLIQRTHAFFDQNHYYLAKICWDILRDHKKTSTRADRITMNYVHELRPLWLARFFVGRFLLPKSTRRFGSIEKLYCAILTHDLGEDYNLSRADLYEKIVNKIAELKEVDGPTQTKLQNMAWEVANIMDLMTFERIYTPEQAREIFAQSRPGEDFDEKEYENIIAQKLYPDNENFFPDNNEIRNDLYFTRDGKGRIIVSRYKRNWNSYLNGLMKNPWAILAKLFDRCEGLATRVGVETFTHEKNKKYAEDTRALFMHRNVIREVQRLYPELALGFSCIDAVMGILHHTLDVVNTYVPQGLEGKRAFDPKNAAPSNFSRYSAALRIIGKVPGGFDLVHLMFERLAQLGTEGQRQEESSEEEKIAYHHVHAMVSKGMENLQNRRHASWLGMRIRALFS